MQFSKTQATSSVISGLGIFSQEYKKILTGFPITSTTRSCCTQAVFLHLQLRLTFKLLSLIIKSWRVQRHCLLAILMCSDASTPTHLMHDYSQGEIFTPTVEIGEEEKK